MAACLRDRKRSAVKSDLGDDPHEGRHVVAKADGRVIIFLAVAGRAVGVALRPGVAAFRCALLVAVGSLAFGIFATDPCVRELATSKELLSGSQGKE